MSSGGNEYQNALLSQGRSRMICRSRNAVSAMRIDGSVKIEKDRSDFGFLRCIHRNIFSQIM
jgi:hypothetical protein